MMMRMRMTLQMGGKGRERCNNEKAKRTRQLFVYILGCRRGKGDGGAAFFFLYSVGNFVVGGDGWMGERELYLTALDDARSGKRERIEDAYYLAGTCF